MKPCPQNRKLIVWLTLDALDAPQAQQLRTHLAGCPGCREYLAEISHVTENLARPPSDLEASERFHRQLAGKLRSARPDSLWQTMLAQFQALRLTNRVAATALLAVLLVLGSLSLFRPSRPPSLPRQVTPPATPSLEAGRDFPPTMANYQRVANESLDRLDALLTEQGRQSSPKPPAYTASTRGFTKTSF